MTSPSNRAEDFFTWLIGTLHNGLPKPLRWIPPTSIGFAILGGFCFAIDMVALTALHGWLHIDYPLAVTIGYGIASVVNFILNRWLNFQAHGEFGKQSAKQLFVVVSNYLIWILAFSSLLEAAGVQYQVSRVVAACVEGVYLYLMMRLWVFPRSQFAEAKDAETTEPSSAHS